LVHLVSDAISLRFESKLDVPVERVWEWSISVDGISAEMRPFLRMTFPRGVRSLNDIPIRPGVPVFRSRVLLFGVLPIDYSDVTLMEFNSGQGFIEQSPMGSMQLWRHERRIVPHPSNPAAVLLVDQLTFQPRMARRLVGWFVRRLFLHRHNVLRANLAGGHGCDAVS